jgi:hypothetical protein
VQTEFWEYIVALAIEEMEKITGKQCLRKHQFGSDSEDFITNFKIVILKNLENFNDADHLVECGKRYRFSTFLKHLSVEAICMIYADIHGVTIDVEKKFTLILGVMKQVAIKKQISVDSVTPKMIHEARPSVTVSDIKAVLHFVKGYVFLEQLMEEDGVEKEVFKESDDLDTNIFDILDYDVEKLFDSFLAGLRDVEKFFVLLEAKCLDNEYCTMTTGQLSCDELLVHIVEADCKFKKNVTTGNVIIQRPNRRSVKEAEAIELKNVPHVNDSLIRYQRANAKKQMAKLTAELNMSDLSGACGVDYFRRQWNDLVALYM